MSTPARAFLFFLLKSERGEINRVFFPVERANTQQWRRSLARPPSPVLPVQVFFSPVALSVSRPPLFSSFLALPLSPSLSLFTSSSTAARATSFSRCFRSNMACAHVQSHVQIFTQPLLGCVQDSEGTTAQKKHAETHLNPNCSTLLNPLTLLFLSWFLSVLATFLLWAPGS